jgi:hypothetical protein
MPKPTGRQHASRALAATALLSLGLSATAAADDLDWLVAPYVWGPSITVEGSGGDDDVTIDLIDKTDTAAMIRVEAAGDRFGVLVDFITIGLSDSVNTDMLPSYPQGANIRADLDLNVLELAGTYGFGTDNSGGDFIFGLRRISTESTLLFTPNGSVTQRLDGGDEFADLMLGARYIVRFNERWDFTIRGDVSFGESEGTYNGIMSVGFRFNEPFALQLGYRHAKLEWEERLGDEPEKTDVSLSGPFLGAVFRF